MDIAFCGINEGVLRSLAQKTCFDGDRVSFYNFCPTGKRGESRELFDDVRSERFFADVFVFDYLMYEWYVVEFFPILSKIKRVPVVFYNDPFALPGERLSHWFCKNPQIADENAKIFLFLERLSSALDSFFEKNKVEETNPLWQKVDLPPHLRGLFSLFYKNRGRSVSISEISKEISIFKTSKRSIYAYISRLQKSFPADCPFNLVRTSKGKYQLILDA